MRFTVDAKLPEDPAALRDQLISAQTQLGSAYQTIERLESEMAWLKRQVFGRKADTVPAAPSPETQDLFATDAPKAQPLVEDAETITYARRKKGHGRRPFPESLPRVEEVVEPKEADKLCSYCGKPKAKIGEDVREVLEHIPQKFTAKEYEKLLQLYAFTERMYDADLGVWLTPDPEEQFFNPYSYNGGDPINMVDPTGGRACSYDEWFSQLDPSFSGTVDCTGDPTDINIYSDRDAEFVAEQYREARANVSGSIGKLQREISRLNALIDGAERKGDFQTARELKLERRQCQNQLNGAQRAQSDLVRKEGEAMRKIDGLKSTIGNGDDFLSATAPFYIASAEIEQEEEYSMEGAMAGTVLGISGKKLVDQGGVKIIHYGTGDVHRPAHAHVFEGNKQVRIGPNGHPLKGQPELTTKMRNVVRDNKTLIRKSALHN